VPALRFYLVSVPFQEEKMLTIVLGCPVKSWALWLVHSRRLVRPPISRFHIPVSFCLFIFLNFYILSSDGTLSNLGLSVHFYLV
jgi:hypothetical protein